MELLLKRDDLTPERTIGRLFIDGAYECFTLEDVVRPDGVKVPGKTAIPAGRYRVVITMSPRFKRPLPLLLGVPHFEGVRIHAGNYATDTEGCILVGKIGPTPEHRDAIFESRVALAELFPKLQNTLRAGEEVWITIENSPQAQGA